MNAALLYSMFSGKKLSVDGEICLRILIYSIPNRPRICSGFGNCLFQCVHSCMQTMWWCVSAVHLFSVAIQAENLDECVGSDEPGGSAWHKCRLIPVHHALFRVLLLVFSQKMQHQPGGETASASTFPVPSTDTADAVFLPVTSSAILVMLPVPAACRKPWVP